MIQNGHDSCAYDQMDFSRNLLVVPVWLPLWYSLGGQDAFISEHRQGKLDPASGLGKRINKARTEVRCMRGLFTRTNCTQAHELCRRHVADTSWYENSDPWMILVVACRYLSVIMVMVCKSARCIGSVLHVFPPGKIHNRESVYFREYGKQS